MTPDDVSSFIEVGVLGTILLVTLFAVIKGITQASVWLAREILIPVKTKFLEHLNQMGEILEAIRQTNADEAGERKQMLKTLNEHTDSINRIDMNVEELKQGAKNFFSDQSVEHQERSKPKH